MKRASSYYNKNKQKELFKKHPLIGIGLGFTYGGLMLLLFSFIAAGIDAAICKRLLICALACIYIALVFVIIGAIRKRQKENHYMNNYKLQNYNLPTNKQFSPNGFKYYKEKYIPQAAKSSQNKSNANGLFNLRAFELDNTSKAVTQAKNNITINQKLNAENSLEKKNKIIENYVGVVISSNNLQEQTENNLLMAIKYLYNRPFVTADDLQRGTGMDDEQLRKTLNLLEPLNVLKYTYNSTFNLYGWDVNKNEWSFLLPPNMPTNNVGFELSKIDGMSEDGTRFEQYVADLLKLNGFISTELTPASNDYGVDVIATNKDNVRYAIQCKCYSNKLGNSCVQEVIGGKSMYNCQVGVVITNNYFTKNAIELAKSNGVLLWDRDKLEQLIKNAF